MNSKLKAGLPFTDIQDGTLADGKTRAQYLQELKAWYIQLPKQHLLQAGIAYPDLPYAHRSPRQKVNIYTPERGCDFPVLFWVHGGAWYTGDRADFGLDLMLPFVEEGYAVVAVGYRLSEEAVFPEPVQDVLDAIAYVVQNAASYKLDIGRMGICSGSAGTTLAATAALISKRFRAVQLSCSILDFAHITEQFAQVGLRRERFDPPELDTSIEALFLGGSVREQPEICRDAMPIAYADGDAPPFLLLHGKVDIDTPYLQSVAFADALNRLTGDSQRARVVLFEETGHDGGHYDDRETFALKRQFLDRYVKNGL